MDKINRELKDISFNFTFKTNPLEINENA